MYSKIKSHCDSLVDLFPAIPEERKTILSRIGQYIQSKKDRQMPVNLVYICTHNSRRSHFGQIWAAVAASYYGFSNIQTFSGGTEATAFNKSAIEALRYTGFEISQQGQSENPKYNVGYGDNKSCTCFSKMYDDAVNPQEKFAAIMTCCDAEENCPFIPGVELRIGTTYEDPKAFDGTPQEAEKYLERSNQIALETLYAFSLVH